MKISERTKMELICGGAMVVLFAIIIAVSSAIHKPEDANEEVTQAYEYVTTETMV